MRSCRISQVLLLLKWELRGSESLGGWFAGIEFEVIYARL
jgi:hypothetical protein